jgi:hypothetical protein
MKHIHTSNQLVHARALRKQNNERNSCFFVLLNKIMQLGFTTDLPSCNYVPWDRPLHRELQ